MVGRLIATHGGREDVCICDLLLNGLGILHGLAGSSSLFVEKAETFSFADREIVSRLFYSASFNISI
jgi:hypothetical protein